MLKNNRLLKTQSLGNHKGCPYGNFTDEYMNPDVERYPENVGKRQEELTLPREMVLNRGLREEYKWMHPCHTLQKKNVLLIHEFNDYRAILFHKGVLLSDTEKILVQQT